MNIEKSSSKNLKVDADAGANKFDCIKDCIVIAKLLNCNVRLHFNSSYHYINENSSVNDSTFK